jgi:lysophospholipase L1-like esterase
MCTIIYCGLESAWAGCAVDWGEVVNADHGGTCASMNPIIATLPEVIPNSYVISSAGLSCAFDHLHFDAAGYRIFGQR